MYLLKPAFEQFRNETIHSVKPMLEKNIVPIQAALVKELDGFRDLLIEKVRRLPHDDGLLEISAKWFGMADDADDVVKIFRANFPEAALGAETANYWVGRSDEAVLLMFAATYPDRRFLTGRMLITF